MQGRFRTLFSKLGNTREQLFHAWRMFHFDENAKTIDAYVQRIRKVVTMLNYGEPQILEVFKNTMPSHLYWVLFPNENLQWQWKWQKGYLQKKFR